MSCLNPIMNYCYLFCNACYLFYYLLSYHNLNMDSDTPNPNPNPNPAYPQSETQSAIVESSVASIPPRKRSTASDVWSYFTSMGISGDGKPRAKCYSWYLKLISSHDKISQVK